MRKPDLIIGPDKNDPYMLRWHLIPRNRWFNIYLHKILKDDDDSALHDHPWWSLGMILRGSYLEIAPDGKKVRFPFRPVFRRATQLHRLVVLSGPVWTIFTTGPRIREWGFACPKGWIPWTEFVERLDGQNVGRGCE